MDVVIGARVRHREQAIVEAHLGMHRMSCGYPVDRTFHFSITRGTATSCFRIVGTTQFDNIAVIVLDHFLTFNDVREAQSDFTLRFQAKKFSRRLLHEVVLLDVQLPAEG